MDFGFSKEQELIKKSVSEFCTKECNRDVLLRMWDDKLGYSRKMWQKMADLGWLGLLFEEKYDGMGLTFVDLCAVLEEMGKELLPAPYISTVVLFGQSISYGGSTAQKEEYLPSLVAGEIIGTLADMEASGSLSGSDITLKAETEGDGYFLNGVKMFVPDLYTESKMIVAARTTENKNPENGITLFIVEASAPGISIKPQQTMDKLRRLSEVQFNGVKVGKNLVLGDIDGGWSVLQKVRRAACAALALEMVGNAQKSLDLSVEYAKSREQFGKPIGSFQAVKHKCADMLLWLETSRSAAYYAAWAISEESADMQQATSLAKAWCADACHRITADAIQIHGGIGFSWEYALHFYFRRAQASDALFGNASYHREEVLKAVESSHLSAKKEFIADEDLETRLGGTSM